MAVRRNINYINKDFTEYRAQLINYAQTYFPTTYTDFSETSPGMMFIEQAAYVGDVLSFYLDNQIQENYVQYARQDNNLYQMAYMFGYKPKVTTLATTEIDFYQIVPSKLSPLNFSIILYFINSFSFSVVSKSFDAISIFLSLKSEEISSIFIKEYSKFLL